MPNSSASSTTVTNRAACRPLQLHLQNQLDLTLVRPFDHMMTLALTAWHHSVNDTTMSSWTLRILLRTA